MASGSGVETLLLRLDVGHESVLLATPPPGQTSAAAVHTHRWTVFVRGQNENSLDPNLIQKVVFHLHDDFPNPKRVVSNPPFEVTETGYGGFVIPIYILFAHSKREQYIEYDMNLKYASQDKHKETKTLEFKDPKPELRARLLKAGAEISSSKPTKVQGNSSSFQDLFGETLRLASPATPSDKTRLPSGLPPLKRQSVSPSTANGSSSRIKHVSIGKPTKSILLTSSPATTTISQQSQSPYHHESDKKRRKSKDVVDRPNKSSKSSGNGGKHTSYADHDIDNQKPSPSNLLESNGGAAQCLLDASKLPPFVSPLSDGASFGTGPVFLSTSSSSNFNNNRDGRRDDDDSDLFKSQKKSSNQKFRQKGAEKSTDFSPTTVRNNKQIQNGTTTEDKSKRKKTKSDSGLDSDYSSGMPNAHSPGVANGQHSIGASSSDIHGGGASTLFSPPDSVRSLDTLQESPASAASTSSSSASSGTSSNSRLKRPNNMVVNGCDEDSTILATTSSTGGASSFSDEDRLRMLILLQQKIMTIKDKRTAQMVADIISSQASYDLTSDCLEFDLCSLDSELIQRLLRIFDVQV